MASQGCFGVMKGRPMPSSVGGVAGRAAAASCPVSSPPSPTQCTRSAELVGTLSKPRGKLKLICSQRSEVAAPASWSSPPHPRLPEGGSAATCEGHCCGAGAGSHLPSI